MKQHGAHQENTTGIKLSVLKSHFTIFLIQNFVQNTKNTCEYHLYCWNHVCKVNEWCLANLGFQLKQWYAIIALQNSKSFLPVADF